MSKTPRFAVAQTPKGWRVRVPQALSDTGKPQTRFFKNRRLAEDFAKDLRGEFRAHGEQASVLPPRVADDALRAWKILEPLGVTLTQVAQEAKKRHDTIARSVPIEDALTAWQASHVSKDLRPATVKSYKHIEAKLLKAFRKRIVADIKPEELEPVLCGKSYEFNRRNARVFWKWCAKAPRKWADPLFFTDVEAAPKKQEKDIAILSPALAERILRTAEQHFPETVATYAVGFFGGPRVEERKRLTEDEFTDEGIDIGPGIAKKRRRRYVELNATLNAWLGVYPFQRCPNWTEKDKAVRRMAGWEVEARILKDQPKSTLGKWPKNAIRHTHASAEIANGARLEDLLFRFGHTEDVETLRSHYVGRMTKKDAIAFWRIGPCGTMVILD